MLEVVGVGAHLIFMETRRVPPLCPVMAGCPAAPGVLASPDSPGRPSRVGPGDGDVVPPSGGF